VTDKNYYQTCKPPDGVKIADNLYYDQDEVTNSNWREFMYWTGRVFGTNSSEYKSTFPDTLVWRDSLILKEKSNCLKELTLYYLHHPAYSDCPVVGISQQQAEAFTKWRSDRVMEYILVRNKEIKWDSSPKRETYFSIEKYYSGKYNGIKPKERFMYYPDYRLPTVNEWKKAVMYDDSIKVTKPGKQNTTLWLDIVPCKNDSSHGDPTERETDRFNTGKGAAINYLLDNVREWTSDSGVTVGGGWHDKSEIVLKQDTFHTKGPNAWTGFRNVCQWKKWGN